MAEASAVADGQEMVVMASTQTGEWRSRSVEDSPSSGARHTPRCVWTLEKSGVVACVGIHDHPLGHQLVVSMDGRHLYSSVHATRGAAEREADELREKARADGWANQPLPSGVALQIVRSTGDVTRA